eukprot:244729-Prymnesium_polylepis.1
MSTSCVCVSRAEPGGGAESAGIPPPEGRCVCARRRERGRCVCARRRERGHYDVLPLRSGVQAVCLNKPCCGSPAPPLAPHHGDGALPEAGLAVAAARAPPGWSGLQQRSDDERRDGANAREARPAARAAPEAHVAGRRAVGAGLGRQRHVLQ